MTQYLDIPQKIQACFLESTTPPSLAFSIATTPVIFALDVPKPQPVTSLLRACGFSSLCSACHLALPCTYPNNTGCHLCSGRVYVST